MKPESSLYRLLNRQAIPLYLWLVASEFAQRAAQDIEQGNSLQFTIDAGAAVELSCKSVVASEDIPRPFEHHDAARWVELLEKGNGAGDIKTISGSDALRKCVKMLPARGLVNMCVNEIRRRPSFRLGSLHAHR